MMGWTFQEYDETPADELLHYMSLQRIAGEILNSKRGRDDD